MNSPEREEVAKQLAEKLGYFVYANRNWYPHSESSLRRGTAALDPDVRDALISREMRVRELEATIRDAMPALSRLEQRGILGAANIKTWLEDGLNSKGEKNV